MTEETFDELFPSFKEMAWNLKPCKDKLFSARENIVNVLTEDEVKGYLKRHCVEKDKVEKAIEGFSALDRHSRGIDLITKRLLLKELGLE